MKNGGGRHEKEKSGGIQTEKGRDVAWLGCDNDNDDSILPRSATLQGRMESFFPVV